jgi:hypothetical protein
VVSIGPYHHGEESLAEMEEFKWQCLAFLVKSSKKDVGQYLESIREREKDAKECYPEKSLTKFNSIEFLKMMVLDGCFIIQFLLFSYPFDLEDSLETLDLYERSILEEIKLGVLYHPLNRMDRVRLPKIYMDLLLLENQIPYLVLEQLFKTCKSPADTNDQKTSTKFSEVTNDQSLSIIGLKVFSAILGTRYHRHKSHRHKSQNEPKYLHLLDLVRSMFSPPEDREQSQREYYRRWHRGYLHLPDLFRFFFILPNEEWPLEYRYRPCDTIPCISKLRRAGIKVNPRKNDNFLIVDFQNGVIEMPTIILNDLMCSFLVNCVAFEQCYKKSSKNFSVYALFLDCLVNTAGDVEYLCDHRVIENYIENEAANFINNLGKGLTFDLNYVDFFVLCKRVNKYYKNSLYRQWTNFKDEYIHKPWLWISGCGALALLVLTFLQTYYTMHT